MWAALLSVSSFGIWAERHSRVGAALSGPLVTTLAALALSNVGVLPTAAPAYSTVTGYLLPLAVPMLLYGADLRRVLRDTGRLLGAFALGAAGTLLGTCVALAVFPMASLGADAWKMAAALCARHIGGAVNFVAVAEALAITPSLVAAGLAADNLICALYFSTLFGLASGITVPGPPKSTATAAEEAPITVASAADALAISAAICAASVAASRALGLSGVDMPIITAVVLLLATAFPRDMRALEPAGSLLAAVLLQIFFAVVGAAGSVRAVLATAPSLFLFALLQVALHLGFTLMAGKRAGYSRAELLIASNACVGGPTTAAGMATSKGWKPLLIPAILMGIAGYSCATFLGIALGPVVLRPLWQAVVS